MGVYTAKWNLPENGLIQAFADVCEASMRASHALMHACVITNLLTAKHFGNNFCAVVTPVQKNT
jgi:hypothetical protein